MRRPCRGKLPPCEEAGMANGPHKRTSALWRGCRGVFSTLRTTELEAKIAEIERMNRLFVGRELRIIELKEKIKELEKK